MQPVPWPLWIAHIQYHHCIDKQWGLGVHIKSLLIVGSVCKHKNSPASSHCEQTTCVHILTLPTVLPIIWETVQQMLMPVVHLEPNNIVISAISCYMFPSRHVSMHFCHWRSTIFSPSFGGGECFFILGLAENTVSALKSSSNWRLHLKILLTGPQKGKNDHDLVVVFFQQ